MKATISYKEEELSNYIFERGDLVVNKEKDLIVLVTKNTKLYTINFEGTVLVSNTDEFSEASYDDHWSCENFEKLPKGTTITLEVE